MKKRIYLDNDFNLANLENSVNVFLREKDDQKYTIDEIKFQAVYYENHKQMFYTVIVVYHFD